MDGTLFTYTHWVGWNKFGRPIQPMIDRVRAWLDADVEVRVVTARIGLPVARDVMTGEDVYSRARTGRCRMTRQEFSDHEMRLAVQDHLERHDLPRLRVQCYKNVDMIEIWDDRAVQVVANDGRMLAPVHYTREKEY